MKPDSAFDTLRDRIRSAVSAVARDGGPFGPGDRASLRRMDPRRIVAPAFWRAQAIFFHDILPGEVDARERAETQWAAVLTGAAYLEGLHTPGRRLGDVLREAGYSDLRFVRLLRANEEQLIDELPMLARYLGARQVPVDWSDAALLLLLPQSEAGERQRRNLARDYYRHAERADAAPTT